MIASIVMFLTIVSLLASGAAWAFEDGLRRLGRPTRWVWLAAMCSSFALMLIPGLTLFGPSERLGGAVRLAPVVELAPIVLDLAEWGGMRLDAALGLAWLLISLGMAAMIGTTHLRLRRERARWERTAVLGREVYLSTDRGPAIAGVARPWIVLPRWALALPRTELDLVLLHEEEHLRGRDAGLLAAALVVVVCAPWNPVAWWQLRRLRMAMEVDCDRRVLRHEPDAERYGNSLISVAARASGASLGLAAFTERSVTLERRIIAMTSKRTRWTPLQAGALIAIAIAIGLQACGVESPVTSDSTETEGVIDAKVQLRSEPTFTPFTVAPSIANRTEVVEAMAREYPPLLRDAGIGGRVIVWFFINEFGNVETVRIHESSGHRALDEAALEVADVFEFSPALNRDEPVPVWVQFPITFQVN
jgi:bla regulator protein BlaR1